jgi:hypothetical protein
MKKLYLMIFILSLMILACSTANLIPATSTPLPTVPFPTQTLPPTTTPTATVTPTQPPPTFTPIPTTLTPTATIVPATSTPPGQPTATVTTSGSVFDSVTLSGNLITWGQNCPASSVTITAHATSGLDIADVLLFVRLQSQSTGVTTRWSDGVSMHTDGAGTFTYRLLARGIPYSQDFQLAWVQYQLVATNSQNRIVGRTPVAINSITLSHCP